MTIQYKKLREKYLDTFGLTMNLNQIAQVLQITPEGLRNMISAKKTPIRIYKLGKRYIADTDDLVNYMQRHKAKS